SAVSRLVERRGPRLPARSGRLLGDRVRLARAGAAPELLPPVHRRPRRPDHPLRPPARAWPRPFPLVLTHGWPSSFVELLKLALLLSDPAGHGADPSDSFDVVIP